MNIFIIEQTTNAGTRDFQVSWTVAEANGDTTTTGHTCRTPADVANLIQDKHGDDRAVYYRPASGGKWTKVAI